jgi:hypothetical protein
MARTKQAKRSDKPPKQGVPVIVPPARPQPAANKHKKKKDKTPPLVLLQ